jgi:hypothetical protein
MFLILAALYERWSLPIAVVSVDEAAAASNGAKREMWGAV